jgi:membrane protein
VLVRCVRRLASADARDRVLILAGQAFIALIPLGIVVASLSTHHDGDAMASYLIRRFHLDGEVASSVHTLFSNTREDAGGITVVSVVILLFSVNSFSRSVRRTAEMAWELPKGGVRGTRDGLIGVALAVVITCAFGALNLLAGGHALAQVAVAIPQLLVGYLGWLYVQWFLVTRRIPRAAMIPGAIVGAVVQLAAGKVSSIYMPHVIESNAEKYGVIGVSFSLVTWLVIAAAVIVCVAIVGAELGRSRIGDISQPDH